MSPSTSAWTTFQDLVPLSIRNTFWHIDQECAAISSAEVPPQPLVTRAQSAPAEGWSSDDEAHDAPSCPEGAAAGQGAEVGAQTWSQPGAERLVTFDPMEDEAFMEELRTVGLAACKPAVSTVANTWPADGAFWTSPSYTLQPCCFGPSVDTGCTMAAVVWQPVAVGSSPACERGEPDGGPGSDGDSSVGRDALERDEAHRRGRVVQLRLAGDNAPVPRSRTTVMLQNLPNNYTRDMMQELLDREGFACAYDFLYMPVDFRTHAAVGYAFINMVSGEAAERLHRHFDGFGRWSVPSGKRCSAGWSNPVQGLDANVKRYRNSPLMHELVPDSYRPILLRDGRRVPFPPPTKKIKPPRQGTERMLV